MDVFESVKSGNFHDASTWENKKIPTEESTLIIKADHVITFDCNHLHKIHGIVFLGGGLG